MKTTINWQKASVFSAIVFLAGWSGSVHQETSSVEPVKSSSCLASEFRRFDFWIGDWDAFDADNPAIPTAHIKVDRILDGCVLREDYQDTNGLKGQSFSIDDSSRKVWHQSWVTNRGQPLLLDGHIEGRKMVLSGADMETLVRYCISTARRLMGLYPKFVRQLLLVNPYDQCGKRLSANFY